ncbi:MAG: hypothetical protein ACI91J_000900 [Yoonia sp.]
MVVILSLGVALLAQNARAADGSVNFTTIGGANGQAFGTDGLAVDDTVKGQVFFGANAGALAAFGSIHNFTQQTGFIFAGTVSGSGTTPGATGVYEIRAWEGTFASYDAAVSGGGKFGNSFDHVTSGQTAVRPTITLGGDAFNFPPDLNSHANFALVPEPTTMVLGLMGLGGLVAARRRQK